MPPSSQNAIHSPSNDQVARECRAILSPELNSDHRRPRVDRHLFLPYSKTGNVCPPQRTPWVEIYSERTVKLVGTLLRGPHSRYVAQAIGPEHTEREADLVAKLLAAPAGAELLDVPCGGGRLSLALASRGYRADRRRLLVGIPGARAGVQGSDRITWEQRDMRDLPWPARFDGAFCVGNSFGYLDDTGNAYFLRAVAAALKPGARFILETPMVLENLLAHIQDRPWWKWATSTCSSEPVRSQPPAASRSNIRSSLEVKSTFVMAHIARASTGSLSTCSPQWASTDLAEPYTRESHVVTFVATAV